MWLWPLSANSRPTIIMLLLLFDPVAYRMSNHSACPCLHWLMVSVWHSTKGLSIFKGAFLPNSSHRWWPASKDS